MKAEKVLKEWMKLSRSQQTSASARAFAKKAGLKSMLEVRTQAWLENYGVPFSYESEKWEYQHEPQHYTPDFTVPKCTIECKGKMTKDTRKKLLSIKRCNPDRELYLVFERPENRIAKNSNTTYAEWAEKHGFKWSGQVPDKEWIDAAKRQRKQSAA